MLVVNNLAVNQPVVFAGTLPFGLTAGTTYFLSPSSAGALTSTAPTATGQVSKPVLVAYSTTAGYFFDWRGELLTVQGSLASASYKRTAGDYTTTSGSFVDVDGTNLALTIVTGARRVLITVVGVAYNNNSSPQNISFDIDLDGARLGGTAGMTLVESVLSGQRLVNISYVTDALSAASHTFKLQWSTTGGTATLRGTTAGYTLRFAVVELAT